MKKKAIFIALGVLLVIAAVVVVLLTKKTPIKTYTVTFDTNGGTTIESQYVEEGNLATKPTDPQKEGYTFLYWTYNNREFNFSTPIVEDIILVAEYTNNEYIITFDSNGGSSVEKQYVVYGGFEQCFEVENTLTDMGFNQSVMPGVLRLKNDFKVTFEG